MENFGARPVTIFSGVMVAGGLMLSAFAPNVEFLIFSYGIVVGRWTLGGVPPATGKKTKRKRNKQTKKITSSKLGSVLLSRAQSKQQLLGVLPRVPVPRAAGLMG